MLQKFLEKVFFWEGEHNNQNHNHNHDFQESFLRGGGP